MRGALFVLAELCEENEKVSIDCLNSIWEGVDSEEDAECLIQRLRIIASKGHDGWSFSKKSTRIHFTFNLALS